MPFVCLLCAQLLCLDSCCTSALGNGMLGSEVEQVRFEHFSLKFALEKCIFSFSWFQVNGTAVPKNIHIRHLILCAIASGSSTFE